MTVMSSLPVCRWASGLHQQIPAGLGWKSSSSLHFTKVLVLKKTRLTVSKIVTSVSMATCRGGGLGRTENMFSRSDNHLFTWRLLPRWHKTKKTFIALVTGFDPPGAG